VLTSSAAEVTAAEAVLGKRAFAEGVGHLRGRHSTRLRMRARHGLAEHLWHLGEWDVLLARYADDVAPRRRGREAVMAD